MRNAALRSGAPSPSCRATCSADHAASRPATASTSRASASAAWAAPTCRRCRAMNLVAMCDVDWSYVDTRFADIPKQMERRSKRCGEATDAEQKDRAQRRSRAGSELQAQIAEVEALHRLPRDARRSRRTSMRWSLPRRITRTRTSRLRPWISANTSTCRSRWPGRWRNAAGCREGAPPPSCRRRWAIRAIPPTTRGW